MTSKNSRTSSPSSPPAQNAPSKLPRFLQKQSTRDRSKSVTDQGLAESRSSSPSGSEIHSTPVPGKTPRKGSKFLGSLRDNGGKDKEAGEEPPVIVEPVDIPRPRTKTERPINSVPDANLPTRLSGWFSHTFSSSSSTDLSLPSLLATHGSPRSKSTGGGGGGGGGALALLTAAKHGKGHLDKAMRYLLDSDSTPDKCTDPIWLMGVQHPGYEPSPPSSYVGSPSSRRGSASPPSFRSSTSSIGSLSSSSNHHEQQLLHSSTGSNPKLNPGANWPPVFYIDFTSTVWLTYRSHFPTPIKDGRLADLCGSGPSLDSVNTPATKKTPWNWVGGEKTWSSDSGWGCMLRTGQSLLANALVHVHLGRDWRKPPHPVLTADYATYVQILTWFLDTPAPEAPFSVHRMALAGKEFGTDVGQWFGPSVAAGTIKTLVNSYPEAGIGVAIAVDGMLYQTDVHAASHGDHFGRSPRRHTKSWGDRPVLVLVGVRLGIDGVNPIYYNTVKALYTFPQSVGIAGGRPKSSYYFVGTQADNLFYLDPHHARPAIPLRPAPPGPSPLQTLHGDDNQGKGKKARRDVSGMHRRLPTSPSSTRTSATGSSTFSYHAPTSPSPLQKEFSGSSMDSEGVSVSGDSEYELKRDKGKSHHGRWRSASQPASPGSASSSEAAHQRFGDLSIDETSIELDPVQLHYCTAYSAAETKTFHCERVRKMPLSGLDPSMLIGFLCKNEEEWKDLRKRIVELPKTIFAIQDEPPSWPEDSEDDMGLESISEPDVDSVGDEEDEEDEDDNDILKGELGRRDEDEEDDDEEDEDDDDEDQFFDTRSISTSSARSVEARTSSRNNDTEEDGNDPVTPGPGNTKFDIIDLEAVRKEQRGDEEPEEGDIEDDWVEPSLPTPMPRHPTVEGDSFMMVDKPRSSPPSTSSQSSSSAPLPPPIAKTKSRDRDGVKKRSTKGKGSSKKSKQVPVPVPPVSRTNTERIMFPVTPGGEGDDAEWEEDKELEGLSRDSYGHSQDAEDEGAGRGFNNGKVHRMHTARARDGGRTQSGGVKGILAEDLA
ncbi:hypothetical protein EST38_g2288 [Candolleomyces aberdarensis]|uniref:Autophagy-related protein 4 n=1 Tax=Candolleomyces aberdarensis TaxID=2316362 RepID=A0A4Q2DVX7_9AGAR|nr:hypothetical protein EST38_g2288 [Candolleomyces aberdarensis]